MDWEALQDGLLAWFADASGLDPATLAWKGDAEVHRAFPQAELSLDKHTSEGSDEVRWSRDEITGLMVPSVMGNRQVTLGIRVQSYEPNGPLKAFPILDRVRTRLALPASIDAFDALDVTVRATQPTVDLGKVEEIGDLTAATLDILLAYTVIESGSEQAAPFIERVEVGGTVYNHTESIESAQMLLYDVDAGPLLYDGDLDPFYAGITVPDQIIP